MGYLCPNPSRGIYPSNTKRWWRGGRGAVRAPKKRPATEDKPEERRLTWAAILLFSVALLLTVVYVVVARSFCLLATSAHGVRRKSKPVSFQERVEISTKKHRRAPKRAIFSVLRARPSFSPYSIIILFLLLRPVASVLPGLPNIGQTCYANAAIQLL